MGRVVRPALVIWGIGGVGVGERGRGCRVVGLGG